MDFPKAPQQLGGFVGSAVNAGVVGLDVLTPLMEGDSSAEPKRTFGAACLKSVLAAKMGGDAAALGAACTDAGLHADVVFAADPELDVGLPSVSDWLAAEGLAAVPL